MNLYRTMKADPNNPSMPMCENSKRGLGVTIEGQYSDVEPEAGFIVVHDGGMSSSPRIEDLPAFLRKRDPVWAIDSQVLQQFQLRYEPDSPRHGLIKPTIDMPLNQYLVALRNTQIYWRMQ